MILCSVSHTNRTRALTEYLFVFEIVSISLRGRGINYVDDHEDIHVHVDIHVNIQM